MIYLCNDDINGTCNDIYIPISLYVSLWCQAGGVWSWPPMSGWLYFDVTGIWPGLSSEPPRSPGWLSERSLVTRQSHCHQPGRSVCAGLSQSADL